MLRKPIQHGTINGYFNHKCRCRKCKVAGSAYQNRPVEGKCDGCGTTIVRSYARWRNRSSSHKSSTVSPPYRVLCESCNDERIAAITVYPDKRTAARENKRRQRASLRAQGLSAKGTPYKSEAARKAAESRIVPPEYTDHLP